MSLLTAKVVENIFIWASTHFFFPRNVLKQSLSSFDMKFQPQFKARKRSYRLSESLTLFWYLIALILGQTSVKGLRVTKIVQEMKFEGIWAQDRFKESFQTKELTKYLILTLVST